MPQTRHHSYGEEADLALSLWVKLARASALFSQRSAEQIRSFGLTEPQFATLEALGHKGPMTLSELSRKQLVSGGNMTVVIDNLEKAGLARRVRSDTDRRAIMVHLTPKGGALLRRIFPRHARHIARLASALTEHEQGELSILLKKLGLSLVHTNNSSPTSYEDS
jgi:MarR family 2-MHQ and catechol resistance regulon transcriptional repressor